METIAPKGQTTNNKETQRTKLQTTNPKAKQSNYIEKSKIKLFYNLTTTQSKTNTNSTASPKTPIS